MKLFEVDKYNLMKEDIQGRQKQSMYLSEDETKKKLIRHGREEAMATARTKLLEELKTGISA